MKEENLDTTLSTLTTVENDSVFADKNTVSELTDKKTASEFADKKTVESVMYEWFSDVVQQTAVESESIKKTLQKMNPPLNLAYKTPKHSTRFVLRVGPMFQAKDDLVDLLTWKTPANTIVAFFLYSACCFMPSLILFLGYLSGFFLLFHMRYQPHKHKIEKKGYLKLDDVSVKSNLNQLQNFMLQYSDGYDWIERNLNRLYKLDDQSFKKIVKYYAVSILFSLIIIQTVPISWCFFAIGCGIFFAGTPFVRSLIYVSSKHKSTIVELLHGEFEKKLFHIKDLVNDFIKSDISLVGLFFQTEMKNIALKSQQELIAILEEGAEDDYVQVIENQRWWPFIGYSPRLFSLDRPLWSTLSGAKYPSLSELDTESRIIWEGEWETIKNHSARSDGWLYAGVFWTKNNLFGQNMTRMRVFRRKMVGVIKSKVCEDLSCKYIPIEAK
jgi:hypothetical protein